MNTATDNQTKPSISNPRLIDMLCNCGRPAKYSHGSTQAMSCNKRSVCLTHDEQTALIQSITNESQKYKAALEKIVNEDGMHYEYKTWANQALKP